MTATPSQTTGWSELGNQTQSPPGGDFNCQANAQIGRGQACYFNATTGNVALTDGTVPGLVCAGVGFEQISALSTVEGGASLRVWKGYGTGQSGATAAGDAIGAADQIVPVFDAGNGIPGKLSNYGGNDRSFMGLAFGLNDLGYPVIWCGPEASAMARAVHLLNADAGALLAYAADATAATTQGTLTGGVALLTIGQVLPRPKRRSILTSVEIIPSAALAAAGTNYRTIQLWKVDTTGAIPLASAALVATFSTATQALVAGQPTAFSLGAAAALTMRETDILVMTSVPSGTGATVPQSAIRANCKVL